MAAPDPLIITWMDDWVVSRNLFPHQQKAFGRYGEGKQFAFPQNLTVDWESGMGKTGLLGGETFGPKQMATLASMPAWPSGAEEAKDTRGIAQQMGEAGETVFNWQSQANKPITQVESDNIYLLLRQIAGQLSKLTGGAAASRSEGGYQFPWGEHGFGSLEQTETYPAASPAFDVTGASGARGAGGWGYGSGFPNFSRSDLYDPMRRFEGAGE
jgi:hypothetical protein